MSDLVMIAAHSAACLIVCLHAICVLTSMTSDTRPSIRTAYILLAIGAFSGIMFPPQNWWQAMVAIGVAAVIVADKRNKARCRERSNGRRVTG
jgi:hypothetical protein